MSWREEAHFGQILIGDNARVLDDNLMVELETLNGLTASATELNILDGATLSTAEINILTGVTSSAAELNILTGVTATATELNLIDGYTGTTANLNGIPSDLGAMAAAVVDFNAAGTAAMTITIDGVAYLEADAADAPNGVWTNGASANDSATSLIAAINGDTRATVPFTAVAGVDTDSVYLFWDAIGTAGNITIASDDATGTVENSLGGAAQAIKQVATQIHTVTTQGLLSGATEIPLPFTPTAFIIQARTSTGLIKAITDLATIQTSPDRIRIDTDGATNLANTDVVSVWAWE